MTWVRELWGAVWAWVRGVFDRQTAAVVEAEKSAVASARGAKWWLVACAVLTVGGVALGAISGHRVASRGVEALQLSLLEMKSARDRAIEDAKRSESVSIEAVKMARKAAADLDALKAAPAVEKAAPRSAVPRRRKAAAPAAAAPQGLVGWLTW